MGLPTFYAVGYHLFNPFSDCEQHIYSYLRGNNVSIRLFELCVGSQVVQHEKSIPPLLSARHKTQCKTHFLPIEFFHLPGNRER